MEDQTNLSIDESSSLRQVVSSQPAAEFEYSEVFLNAPISYFILARDGGIRQVNRHGADLFKIERAQLIGANLAQFIADSNRPAFIAFLEHVFTSQEKGSIEVALLRSGVDLHWVKIEAAVSQGGPTCCVVVVDISDYKQTEDALRQSEEKFSEAFRISPDSININRLSDGMYIEINEGFKSLTGYTTEEVIGKTSLEINIWANPQDRARLVQGLREKGEVHNLETPFRIKNGNIKICLMSARAIEINGEKCILSITRDITERKLIEKEYSTFIQASFDGFWSCDITGHFFDVNDALCQILGYTREELLGMCIADIEVSEKPVEVAAHIQKIIQTGRDRFQTQHRRKDGTIIDVEISAQYIGAPVERFYDFIRDISERKRAEKKNNEQIEELRRWHAITLGREKRIRELKGEVNELLKKNGLPARYTSFLENQDA